MNGKNKRNRGLGIAGTIFLLVISIGITGLSFAAEEKAAEQDVLVLGAYTVPKEAYEQQIIPAFQKLWKEKTGKDLKVEQSYVGSGAQARAIIGGFEADIAALSLEGDIDQVVQAGLITNDWKKKAWNGFISHSVVAFGVREGNPKKINDWEDIAKEGIQVIYPNPKTSGGAQWFVNAIYGAGLKMTGEKTGTEDKAYARDLMKRIQKNVKVMDKSGRESMTTFERGIGDVIITYENELMLRKREGRDIPMIIPRSTILIQNPVAIVDKNVDKHKTRELAEAFVAFLQTDFAQNVFADYGFRSPNPEIAKNYTEKYPVPALLFNMEYLGGWTKVNEYIYGPTGIWTEILKELADNK